MVARSDRPVGGQRHRLRSARELRHGNKNDRSDADESSELLRRRGLRVVYHGNAHRVRLKELTRAYQNLVGDTTRVMLRLKALFRARGIKTPGQGVYHSLEQRPQWRAQLEDPGSQLRAKHAPRRP